MKYIWEPKDIEVGMFVCKHFSYQGNKSFVPCYNSIKWTFQVGWISSQKDHKEYNTICLADGMINRGKTKEVMAELFNKEELVLMPYDWLVKSIELKMKGYYRVT